MSEITLSVYLNTLRQKGYLAYEYNPFYNYQTNTDLYLIDKQFYVPKGCAVNIRNGEILTKKHVLVGNNYQDKWVDKRGYIVKDEDIKKPEVEGEQDENNKLYAKAGSLIDLDTDKLNFDLEHPVDIQVQPSYDGSVNLILNDNKNIPRLINSRFSAREKNTYEIVDRIGENDTNIYSSEYFDKDTSLYFQYESNPIITFSGYVKGILPVGQYCFYFTYCDSDDNESDYIAETGVIPAFIGSDCSPTSIDGGIKNQISHKGIRLILKNIDQSYSYLKIYYVRYFADYQQNRVYEAKEIVKKYYINTDSIGINITGNEEAQDIDANLLNIDRFNPKKVLTQAQCKNMLFFGNIVKNTDNYTELSDCALRIYPSLVQRTIDIVDNDYDSSTFGYYNSSNMYNNVGYFNEEYYRFGVVFIYQNGTVSRVFNTLGGEITNNDSLSISGRLFKNEDEITLIRQYIKVDDNGWIKQSDGEYTLTGQNINSKGVCHFNLDSISEDTLLGIKFNIPQEVADYLRNDLNIRGLFFVRQKCVPNILAQCYLMPIDEQLEAPVLEVNVNSDSPKYFTETFVTQAETYSIQLFGLLANHKLTKETNESRLVNNDYPKRLYKYKYNSDSTEFAISSHAYAGICPDFLLNQPYFNQIFNGSKFILKKISSGKLFSTDTRFYKTPEDLTQNSRNSTNVVIINTVTEDLPNVAIKDQVYRLEMGKAEESYRFQYCEIDSGVTSTGGDDTSDKVNKSTNLVRGKYSPYLAIYSEESLETGALYNIYQDSTQSVKQEYQNRMDSSEPFYAISDRYNFSMLTAESNSSTTTNSTTTNRTITCYRGDCYINTFTYRLNRNFNDPSLPNNDVIVDENTWKDNYDINNPSQWENIYRSDLNAVQLGSWITFKVRSSMNYALRSQDHSYTSEEALMGSPRSFYPRTTRMWRGENKLPDSYLYNDAYRATLGFKCYFAYNDVNYIKDSFSNRIQYSAVAVQDSYKNNFRLSYSTYYRDYSAEYGGITKLLEYSGGLLVVFEHGIGLLPINERVLAGNGEGEPIFINTNNVLPEQITIVSDSFGSQWTESIIKSNQGYVYGVDTVSKKIWRVGGQDIQILSDFKVNKFLIDNISLGERELTPKIGLRNVKTHYNNNKNDVLFTFYDETYKDEEKVWNLCYNELLDQFITFYSWVPSYSENINTQFFTFDRDTTKELALLSKCSYSIPENSGILVETPVINDSNKKVIEYKDKDDNVLISSDNYYVIGLYYTKLDSVSYTIENSDGTTSIKTATDLKTGQYLIPEMKYKIEKDHWENYKYAEIIYSTTEGKYTKDETNSDINGAKLCINKNYFEKDHKDKRVISLYISPCNIGITGNNASAATYLETETVALTLNSIITNRRLTDEEKNKPALTTDFYLHGQAGIFDISENLYPTYWYGKQHPFEFEFVVNDNIASQKIFNNLVIISNKAEPESFHFEIEGDNYDFSSDKRTMYFRQEFTKEVYQNLGCDILFNRYYEDIMADMYTKEEHYRGGTGTQYYPDGDSSIKYTSQYHKLDKVYPIYSKGLVQQEKSTIFPLYYERVDTYDDIYDKYTQMAGSGYDFKNLSGSEITWNRDLNQFNIVTHIKNNQIDLCGRLRGNSRYKEGKWNIQIPSITFMQKNEFDNKGKTTWVKRENSDLYLPPVVLNSSTLPSSNSLQSTEIKDKDLPNIYSKVGDKEWYKALDLNGWTCRKETRIRDKWIKIRVRYSGKNLVVIHSLITLYEKSYS